jgi:hypothetical protein
LKYLRGLSEQLSWTRRYFEEHLNVVYRGSGPLTECAGKLRLRSWSAQFATQS